MAGCVGCSGEVQLEDTFCARCGAPVTDPFIGTIVGERYRIVSRIGVGGMGAVYRAEHTMMRRDLAIKVLLPELSGKEEFARRFEREAESASRLDHPNIITTTDFGRTGDGSLFLAMEFLAGTSLGAAIAAGPMRVERALAIERQILRGLDHAHAAGVVHRDLKPENIMLVERDGQRDVVKILDFGIAKVTEPQSGGQALTQAGVIFGTPEYLSPEQALGEAVDARADIYAAGVILYEMLAGRRPFESEDKVKIISMHLAHAPPRVRDVNPAVDLPLPLEQAVLQAMEKSRDNRFATAAAFMQALDDAEVESQRDDEFAVGATLAQTELPPRGAPAARAARRARAAGGRGRRAHHQAPDRASSTGGRRAGGPAGATGAAAARSRRRDEEGRGLAGGRQHRRGPGGAGDDAHLAAQGRARALYVGARVLRPGQTPGSPRRLRGGDRARSRASAAIRCCSVTSTRCWPIPSWTTRRSPCSSTTSAIRRPTSSARSANEGSDLTRRRRAAAALVDLDEEKRIDRVSLDMLELRKAPTCDEKKDWVEKLRKLGDARALPTLRGLRARRMGPISWGGRTSAA